MTDGSARQMHETLVEGFLREHPHLEPEIPGHGPPGWDQIVVDALVAIDEHSTSRGVEVVVAQIKEKFGGLRVYTHIDEASWTTFDVVSQTPSHTHLRGGALKGSVREGVHKIVDAAVGRAAAVCERCGRPRTRTCGFYQFCGEHSQTYS